MTIINRFNLIVVLSLLHSAASLAADGTLIYAPIVNPVSTAPIPTLSETMLIVLSLLLVAIAFRVNQKSHSNTLMLVLVSVFGMGSILSTTGGISIITDVYAGGGNGSSGGVPIPLASSTGGQVTIPEDRLSIYENTSGRNQQIIEINQPANCSNTDAGLIQGVSRCHVGGTVPTTMQGMCYIDCRVVQVD